MKWVAWMNYGRGRSKGAKGQFQYKAVKYTRFFTGPKNEATSQAYSWVVKKRKELGVVFSQMGPRSKGRKKDYPKLPIGVTITVDRRRRTTAYHATAYINSGGRQHKAYFSFARYGRDKAIEKAKQWRERLVKELKNTYGIMYCMNHG